MIIKGLPPSRGRALYSSAPLHLPGHDGEADKQNMPKSDAKKLCLEDENDFQPNSVFDYLRIFHCHPHFNDTHSGNTP